MYVHVWSKIEKKEIHFNMIMFITIMCAYVQGCIDFAIISIIDIIN